MSPSVLQTFQLAVASHGAGKFEDARRLYEQVLQADPKCAQAMHNLGVIAGQQSDTKAAEQWFTRSVDVDPNNWEFLNNLGTLYQRTDRADRAMETYRRSAQLQANAPAYRNIGVIHSDRNQFAEAMENFERALAIDANHAEAHSGIGGVYQKQGELPEALAAYERAAARRASAINIYKIAVVHREMGDLAKSLEYSDRALGLKPDLAEAHLNKGLALLVEGRLVEAWPEYEWRWKCERYKQYYREFPMPRWEGEDLKGRSILLHGEQGFGDEIQFIRYASMVKQQSGARTVAVECSVPLAELFRTVEGIDQVVPRGEPLPWCDRHLATMDLPRVFKTTLETIPGKVPYLKPDAKRVERWRERMKENGEDLKVGLVWAGSAEHPQDHLRSVTLEMLAPLVQGTGGPDGAGPSKLRGVTFYALQKGPAAAQSKSPPGGMKLKAVGDELKDFSETAALVENLDLVITVDTSVAHMAGALGKKVWVLVAYSPDWRWMLGREDSPWYPTMRLFRQSRPREWGDVVERVARELRNLDR